MRKLAAVLAGAMLMMATSAIAVPISGNINFGGGTLDYVGGTNFANSTGITFNDPSYVTKAVTGIFASIPTGRYTAPEVTFTSFSYTTAPLLLVSPSPVDPFWTFMYLGNTYSFELDSISSVTSSELIGTGVFKIKNTVTGAPIFDDTKGLIDLTAQGSDATVSFSATSTVPEPGTMVLLGFGMLGLAIYGKRRMNKEA